MPAHNFTIEEITLERRKLAQLVLIDRAYLPIFERINQELEAMQREEDLLVRARAIVNG